ncbi:hypothetical protein TNCV_2270481 [Trichonephila clavipes]|nr:hypothetical protein TNCV_2270481 [Trichonephila clavipes]
MTITQATHPQNQTVKKRLSFASRQCKTTLLCTNTVRHRKTDIHSGSTASLQPRFLPFGLLVVFKIEKDVERLAFFNGYRSSGSHEQMDTQATRIFLQGQNEEMDRTIEQMCSC